MDDKSNPKNEQLNNPLHGVKLINILELLVAHYGWEQLAMKISINCFKKDPSIKSCLKFLRKTQWARDKVEQLYIELDSRKK
jgi:uncharacterized protein (DUF2132 family)